jgi:hypothetical protein
VLGFQYLEDAKRLLEAVQERLGKFGLEIHPDKTRLIEFGRYAIERRKLRGEGRPETKGPDSNPTPRLRIKFAIIVIHVKGFRMATPVGS